MVVIHWVPNGNDMVLAPKQHLVCYIDVRYRVVQIDFIDKNGGSKDVNIAALMFKCTLE